MSDHEGLGEPLNLDLSGPDEAMEPAKDRLDRALNEIRSAFAQTIHIGGGLGRSEAGDFAGDAYRRIWTAVHDGETFDPVSCPCGNRWEGSPDGS